MLCAYENGVLTYQEALFNASKDEVVIDSFEFPDTGFKVRVGLPFYGDRYLSWVKLESDRPVNIKDYRFIINYKDNKYPPQTIHVNLYPDQASADKAYEERTSVQDDWSWWQWTDPYYNVGKKTVIVVRN